MGLARLRRFSARPKYRADGCAEHVNFLIGYFWMKTSHWAASRVIVCNPIFFQVVVRCECALAEQGPELSEDGLFSAFSFMFTAPKLSKIAVDEAHKLRRTGLGVIVNVEHWRLLSRCTNHFARKTSLEPERCLIAYYTLDNATHTSASLHRQGCFSLQP